MALEILDQNSAGNGGVEYFGHSTRGKFIYQSFIPDVGRKLTKFIFSFKKGAGSPNQLLTGYLYSNNGGVPGTLLSTLSSFNANTLTSSFADYSFTKDVASAYSLVAGTIYHLVVGYAVIDDSNYIHVEMDPNNVYADGNNGCGEIGTWVPHTEDLDFKQYYTGDTHENSLSLGGVAVISEVRNIGLYTTLNIAAKGSIIEARDVILNLSLTLDAIGNIFESGFMGPHPGVWYFKI